MNQTAYVVKDRPETAFTVNLENLTPENLLKAATKGFFRWVAEDLTGKGYSIEEQVEKVRVIEGDINKYIAEKGTRKAGIRVPKDPLAAEILKQAKDFMAKHFGDKIKAAGFKKMSDYFATEKGMQNLEKVKSDPRVIKAAEKVLRARKEAEVEIEGIDI